MTFKGRIPWNKGLTMETDERLRIFSKIHKGKYVSLETRRKQSEAHKGKHRSLESRKKQSESIKGEKNHNYGKHFSLEHRKKIGESKKGNQYALGYQHTEEARRRMSEANKSRNHKPLSEEHRKKISEALKGRYSPMKGKKRIFSHMKGKHHSMETRKKMSEAQKGEKNPNYGKKQSKEHIQKRVKAWKGHHHSEESKAKMRITGLRNRLRQVFSVKDTSIEVALQNELNRRELSYKKHIPICGVCLPDIVFPDQRIAIFADGDYWHSKEFKDGQQWKKDRNQDKVLRENGWIVHRFWEHEINTDVESCINKINI